MDAFVAVNGTSLAASEYKGMLGTDNYLNVVTYMPTRFNYCLV